MTYTEIQTKNYTDSQEFANKSDIAFLQQEVLADVTLPLLTEQAQIDTIFADTSDKLYVVVLGFPECKFCPVGKSSLQDALDLAEKNHQSSNIQAYDLDIHKYTLLDLALTRKSRDYVFGYPQVMMIQGGKVVYHKQGTASSDVILGFLKKSPGKSTVQPTGVESENNPSTKVGDSIEVNKIPLNSPKRRPVLSSSPTVTNTGGSEVPDAKLDTIPPVKPDRRFRDKKPGGVSEQTPATGALLKKQEGDITDYPKPVVEKPKAKPKQKPVVEKPTPEPTKLNPQPKPPVEPKPKPTPTPSPGPETMPQSTKNLIMGKVEMSKAGIAKVGDAYCVPGEKEYLSLKALEDFKRLHKACLEGCGIDIRITSGYRSFADQVAIWNKKRNGNHPSYPGLDKKFPDPVARAKEIMKRSSMPGASRHHWGTDFDIVFQQADGKRSNLTNTSFDTANGKKLYTWLDQRARDYGFCQPYSNKSDGRTGYNEEKWHRSHIDLAKQMMKMAIPLQDSDFSGFDGAETAVKIGVVDNYIYGVSEECRK